MIHECSNFIIQLLFGHFVKKVLFNSSWIILIVKVKLTFGKALCQFQYSHFYFDSVHWELQRRRNFKLGISLVQ